MADVLSPAELKSIALLPDASAFRDGSASARAAAKEVKKNLEFRYAETPARDVDSTRGRYFASELSQTAAMSAFPGTSE